MILTIIAVLVLLSAILMYNHVKPKHCTPRISMRHVKLRKPQDQNEDWEESEDEEDFLLFEEDY